MGVCGVDWFACLFKVGHTRSFTTTIVQVDGYWLWVDGQCHRGMRQSGHCRGNGNGRTTTTSDGWLWAVVVNDSGSGSRR